MKKLLCGLICASAVLTVVAVETTVSTIDVIAVDSGLKNTIVAIPGLDLAGGDLVISNLVKTTNLSEGDKLYAFSGGEYESWELNGGHWQRAATRVSISASDGTVTTNESTQASLFSMPVGSGIWLQRSVYANPFYVYAQHVDSPTTTVAPHATALVGNPTVEDKRPKIATPTNGDRIVVPTATLPKYYTYVDSTYVDSKWTSISEGEVSEGLPTITAGTGFWYISNGESAVEISW